MQQSNARQQAQAILERAKQLNIPILELMLKQWEYDQKQARK
jgi:hypothetical protein